MAEVVHPPGWPAPRGYSNGMRAQGTFIAVAGQIAWDETNTIVSQEFVAQFRQALANVAAVVETGGGAPSDIVSLTLYVTDKSEYVSAGKALGQAYRDVLGRHYPAMALVEVAGLLEPGAKVEIQALAVISAGA